MSDIFKKQFQNQQEFSTELHNEIKKEAAPKFDKKGMDKFMQNYMNYTNNAEETKSAFDNLQIIMYDQEAFEGEIQQDVLKDKQAQRQAETDRLIKKSHSGKESDQEKAANARKTFGDFQYNTDTAKNIMTAYLEKKEAYENDKMTAKEEIDYEKYKPTGKELLLMPGNNMQGGPTDDIVNLMMKRDILKKELKEKLKHPTIHDESKRKFQSRLLEYMEDAINTFFKANGVSYGKDGKAKNLSAKERDAARQHLALAMEKYEIAARNFDTDVANDMMPKIEKTSTFKLVMEQEDADVLQKSTEAENKLLSLLSKNADKVGNKSKDVKKVYADFEKINSQKIRLEAKVKRIDSTDIKSIVAGPLDEDEYFAAIETKKVEYQTQVRSLEMAANACKAYIEYVTTGKAMSMVDAAYLEKEYNITGVDIQVTDKNGKMLRLNLDEELRFQTGAMSEYYIDFMAEAEAKMDELRKVLQGHTEEEIKNDKYLSGIKDDVDTFDESRYYYPRRCFEIYIKVADRYNLRKGFQMSARLRQDKKYGNRIKKMEGEPGGRDIVTVINPIEGEEVPSYEECLKVSKLVSIVVRSVDPEDDPADRNYVAKKPSAEQTINSYHKLKPYLIKAQNEMKQYMKNYPGPSNLDKMGDQLDFKNFFTGFDIPLIIAKKAQGLMEMLMPMLKNETLTSQLSYDEHMELFEMLAYSGAVNSLGNQFCGYFTKMTERTPRQILEKKVGLPNGPTPEEHIENNRVKFQKYKPAPRPQ